MEIQDLTLKQAGHLLANKKISATELAQSSLSRIGAVDPKIHAFLHVSEEKAMTDAQTADTVIAKSVATALTGIPYALKDNILAAGLPATAASKILENYIATYDATVVKKLQLSAPVLMGKTNLDEFAMGSSTENSSIGLTKNPYDVTRVAGGSSGGSAAAVAAGEVLFALGTDTGGSIRQPASFCGVVGLKPTYGRVSRFGAIAMASSLDQIGVFAKTVEDTALAFEVIAGDDRHDTTTLPKPVPDHSQFLKTDLQGMRIGIPKEYFIDGIDPEVREIIQNAIKQFERLGASIEEMSLPHSKYALACYYIIMPVEVSANLSRYDGIRYGLSAFGENLEQVYINSRTQGLGDEVKRRIMIGAYASSAGYFDAYYKKALNARQLIRRDFQQAFAKYDLLLTPTAPNPAFQIGSKTADPMAMYLEDIFTVSLNIAGVPGMSVPAGLTGAGLPVGLQMIAPHFAEERLFHAGFAFEQALGQSFKPNLN